MINITFIKKQITDMGISVNKLKDITGVGYATLSDYLNKPKYNISAKHYTTIVNTLFTPFEQLLYANAVSRAQFSKFSSAYWYDELKRRKIKSAIENDTIDIQLSGAVASDDDGIVRSVPAHIDVTFKDIEGKTSIRIFDTVLYRKMGSAGQRLKKELLLKHLESEKESNKVFELSTKSFQEQYNQLQAKVESKGNDHTVHFYRGHFLKLKNEGLNIAIDFEKCTIESYAEINFMRYAENSTTFDNMNDLYHVLYMDYKQYFPTDSLASKTIVWIKQLLVK